MTESAVGISSNAPAHSGGAQHDRVVGSAIYHVGVGKLMPATLRRCDDPLLLYRNRCGGPKSGLDIQRDSALANAKIVNCTRQGTYPEMESWDSVSTEWA